MDSHTQSHGKSRKIRVRGARKTYPEVYDIVCTSQEKGGINDDEL